MIHVQVESKTDSTTFISFDKVTEKFVSKIVKELAEL